MKEESHAASALRVYNQIRGQDPGQGADNTKCHHEEGPELGPGEAEMTKSSQPGQTDTPTDLPSPAGYVLGQQKVQEALGLSQPSQGQEQAGTL